MDVEPILSCMTLTVECDGKSVVTIEGLQDPKTGELNALQQSFIDQAAFQCGFCTPGIIMTAQALLDKTPDPSEDEIQQALVGHFCRCISHYEVVGAIKDAAKERIEQPAPNGYRHIGKGTPRGDAEEIVSGKAAFISDLKNGYEGIPNALSIEPPGAIARWEGPYKVTIWSATQSPFLVRRLISAELGDVLPPLIHSSILLSTVLQVPEALTPPGAQ
jgi:hypothetical protein